MQESIGRLTTRAGWEIGRDDGAPFSLIACTALTAVALACALFVAGGGLESSSRPARVSATPPQWTPSLSPMLPPSLVLYLVGSEEQRHYALWLEGMAAAERASGVNLEIDSRPVYLDVSTPAAEQLALALVTDANQHWAATGGVVRVVDMRGINDVQAAAASEGGAR